MSITLTSPAFQASGPIPARYTCEGEDVSPPLAWSGLPAGARSLALIVEDPDAPDPAHPRTTWTHWIVYDLPASEGGLAEGVRTLPAGAREGHNDWKQPGYRGPCPPVGRHRYVHRLFGLDTVLGELNGPSRADLLSAMEGHVLGEGELIGTYQKAR